MSESRIIYSIIVTYNGENWIEPCIESLKRSTVPVNILVVDNNSTDNTTDILEKFEGIEVIHLKENQGFGQANNHGIEKALKRQANFILLINQDAEVEPNTIEILVKHSEANPEYGILSPVHFFNNKETLDLGFSNHTGIKKNQLTQEGEAKSSPVQVRFVNAALWLMNKAVIEQVGGFDPLFFHYGEDDDYCTRVWERKMKVGVITSATGFHNRPQKQFKNRESLLREYQNSYLLRMKDPGASPLPTLIRILKEILFTGSGNPLVKRKDLINLWLWSLRNIKKVKYSRKMDLEGNYPYLAYSE